MNIKRVLTFVDEVRTEAGQRVDPPLRKVAVVAVIDNPFAGRFVPDLKPLTDASAEIGRHICGLAVSLLGRVGLSHRLAYYPRQLSVGQQQRVAVARALANRPKLVLADEPTGNLDETLAQETLTLLRETCTEQGAALLLVSHAREILAQFTDVLDFKQLNQT